MISYTPHMWEFLARNSIPMEHSLAAAFALFDRDGDGLLVGADVAPALMSCGLYVKEPEMEAAVPDPASRVSKDQFMKMGDTFFKGRDPKAELLTAFKLFDRDNNGTILSKEFEFVADSLGSRFVGTDIQDIVKLADPNGEGKMKYQVLIDLL